MLKRNEGAAVCGWLLAAEPKKIKDYFLGKQGVTVHMNLWREQISEATSFGVLSEMPGCRWIIEREPEGNVWRGN